MVERALLLDISNYQGYCDFDALAHAPAYLNGVMVGTVEGVIAKSTEGTHFTDAYLHHSWREASRVGLAIGAYHFMRADLGNSGEAEARHMWSVVGPLMVPGANLLLDVEDFPGRPQPHDLNAWVHGFLDTLASLCGFRPGLYSTASYLQSHNVSGDPGLADNGLWIASWYDYPASQPFPAAPPAWPFAYLWQFTAFGEVAGVAGQVDLDYCNGPIETFKAYGKPAEAAGPPLPREPLDAWYTAWEDARAVYDTPPDLSDWDAMIPYFDAVKDRHGVGP